MVGADGEKSKEEVEGWHWNAGQVCVTQAQRYLSFMNRSRSMLQDKSLKRVAKHRVVLR